MNTLQKIKYRMKLRIELQKADMELLKITTEELKREYDRRNKK